jgi:hypothetical protein
MQPPRFKVLAQKSLETRLEERYFSSRRLGYLVTINVDRQDLVSEIGHACGMS